MTNLKSMFTSLIMAMPPAVRGLVMLAGVGGIAGLILAMTMFGFTGPVFYWTMTIGLIVIALLGAMFVGITKWRKKRKARAASEVIQDSAGGAEGVSEPDEIARLDQLRKDWDAAVKRFQENNDEGLYSLPWYLLVGEPGSGKTEAIRHSGIPFPTGLNKPNQGTGGTYNMDWWFANDAIIIDTAGRLLFNETREWAELLKSIGKVRPNCPINGMLLVIPTDSLLKDSSQEIEHKASRIAEQINSIKRELGIRFPVFVVITKSDFITGFREYFSHIDDPTLEHQMLGWSNPHSLDEPFNPDLVDEHLNSVSERLRRRRTAMLLDPPVVDETSDRTTDQVDALYAFPEEIQRIKNRLRLYMEQIFTPGPWSKKPPFIRGIYFTSSMQEGKELDTALAEMLDVDVADLPEGRAWTKDRAYFLRDLFMQKVFPEQGLVTRAANATQNYRRNKVIVNGVGVAAIALAVVFIFFAYRDFRRSIGDVYEWWQDVATMTERHVPTLVRSGNDVATAEFAGDDPVELDGHSRMTVVELLQESSEKARKRVGPGGLLLPIEMFVRSGIADDPRRVNSALVNKVALDPLIEQTRLRLDAGWSDGASEAVAQVVRMASFGHDERGNPDTQTPRVEPLMRYVFGDGGQWKDAASKLQNAVDAVFLEAAARNLAGLDVDAITRTAEHGIERWRAYWLTQSLGDTGLIAQFEALHNALEEFEEAETQLLALATPCRVSAEAWSAEYRLLSEARSKLDSAAKPFSAEQQRGDLKQGIEDRFAAFRERMEREYEMLAGELPDLEGVKVDDESQLSTLQAMRTKLDSAWSDVTQDLEEKATPLLARILEFDDQLASVERDVHGPGFAVRGDRYAQVNAQLERRVEDVSLLTLGEASQQIQEELQTLRASALPRGAPEHVDEDADRATRSAALLACALQTTREVRLSNLYQDVLSRSPTNAAELARMVRDASPDQDELPRIVLTRAAQGVRYDGRYDSNTVEQLLLGWSRILEDDADGSLVTDRHRRAIQRYLAEYIEYWTKTVPDNARVHWANSWESYRRELNNLPRSSVNEQLHLLTERILESLVILERIDLDDTEASQVARFKEHMGEIPDGGRSSDVVVEWTRIGETTRVAQRRLLAMRPTEFHDLFPTVPVREEGPRPMDYWSQISYEGLRLVADAASRRGTEALEALQGYLRAFPLCMDAPEELSVQQVERALEHLHNLLAAPVAVGRGQDTLGQGAWSESGLRDDLINTLRGYHLMADLNSTAVENMRQFVTTLVEGELDVLIGGYDENRGAELQFRHVELWIDDAMYRRWTRSGSRWPVDATAISPAQQGRVEFRFYYDELKDTPDEVAALGTGGWPIIRGILHRNTRESDGIRRVPVDVGSHTVWIGVTLAEEQTMPSRNNWPRLDTWPF